MSENQQLTKVKSILEDLGMEGRPSLFKCEAIKEKIEYEKEMQAIDTSNIIETSRRTPQQQQSSQRVHYIFRIFIVDLTFIFELIFKSDSEEDEDKLDLSKIGDPEDSN